MALLVLLNNFLHDFSAAGWLFGMVLVGVILKRIRAGGEGLGPLKDVLRTVLRLMSFSLAGIILFGVVRALAYRRYEWSVQAGQGQVTLLLVKHVFLAGLVAAGFILTARARKSLRQK
jgi:putative copper export protein